MLPHTLSGSGSPLVFIHGFSLDQRLWQAQVPVFEKHYQVLRYDLRGFGQAPPPTEPYTHHADLKALLDELQLPPAILVGLSLGGSVAAHFALTYPEHTRAVVLVDSLLAGFRGWGPEILEHHRVVWHSAAEMGLEVARQHWLASPMFAPAQAHPHSRAELMAMVNDYSGWHWLNRDPQLPFDPPALERLSEITAPTLILVGEHDIADFHTIAQQYQQRLPQARLVILPGVGHLPNLENPTQFNAVLAEFLASLA